MPSTFNPWARWTVPGPSLSVSSFFSPFTRFAVGLDRALNVPGFCTSRIAGSCSPNESWREGCYFYYEGSALKPSDALTHRLADVGCPERRGERACVCPNWHSQLSGSSGSSTTDSIAAGMQTTGTGLACCFETHTKVRNTRHRAV